MHVKNVEECERLLWNACVNKKEKLRCVFCHLFERPESENNVCLWTQTIGLSVCSDYFIYHSYIEKGFVCHWSLIIIRYWDPRL